MAKFKFKRRKKYDPLPVLVPRVSKDVENLTGFVRGFNASDIEERFARALIKLDIGFWFQYKVETAFTMPEYQKRVDFIVFWMPGKVVPVEIYGDHWHSTAGDKARDTQREIEINEAGAKYGWQPLEIVWGRELTDQQLADAKARELFI